MSWAAGLILVVLLACVVPLLFAEIADRFGTRDDDEWDHVAERKRLTERRARQQSGEMR